MFRNKYPYTNFHELNLDWIVKKIKNLENDVRNTSLPAYSDEHEGYILKIVNGIPKWVEE